MSGFESIEAFYRATYGPYVQEIRLSGETASMLEAAQPAGDVSDAAVPELVLNLVLGPAGLPATMDLGAGRFRGWFAPGDFILVPPQTPTRIVVDSPHRIIMLGLTEARIAGLLHQAVKLDFGPMHSSTQRDVLTRGLVESIWAEARQTTHVTQLFLETALAALVARLLLLAEAAPRRQPAKGGLAPWQLRRACELLADMPGADISLSMLADRVGLSPFHFARMFKRSTGLPPHAYQRRMRCERAQHLLRTTDLPVTEIALSVGYATSQAFARMFLAETGVTPTAWRRDRRG